MKYCTLVLAGLWLLSSPGPSAVGKAASFAQRAGKAGSFAYVQPGYLGKSAPQWQQELMQAKDAKTKRSAAFALGKLGPQAFGSVQALVTLLESDSEDIGVRETAVYALGEIIPRGNASREVAFLLCKLANLKGADDRLARSAIVALGKCASDTAEVRAALESALEDPNPGVRQNAAWAIGEVCLRAQAPPLGSLRLVLAARETDRLVQRDAALALDKIVGLVPPVGGGDVEQQERERIVKVREQARAAIPELLGCVSQDYVELKKAAAGALINLVNSKDVQAKAVLARACGKDEDMELRFNAARALAAIGGPGAEAAVPVLQDVLRTKKDDPARNIKGDPAWRQTAVLAFRNLGSVAAAALPDLLEALAKDSDKKVRLYAAHALGGWESNRSQVVPALVQRIADGDEDTDVRVAAGIALKSIGKCPEAVAAIPALVKVLGSSKQPPPVREHVLWALRVHEGELANHKEVFGALKEILVDEALRGLNSGGKMLRYDAAYIFAVFKKAEVPAEVFPVLNEFLHDDKVRIFTGLVTGSSRVAEGGGGGSVVAVQGGEDARIMAVQALEAIGRKRINTMKDASVKDQIIAQLRLLNDPSQLVEPNLYAAVGRLMKELGLK
jgi:HEAT repeat protein